jgi:hypothetical protein
VLAVSVGAPSGRLLFRYFKNKGSDVSTGINQVSIKKKKTTKRVSYLRKLG